MTKQRDPAGVGSQVQASAAKEKGNKAFRESKWLLATKHYQEAERLDPTNPVYPSNLSAAFFEMGNYSDCAAAILRSCSHLDFEKESSLASRLSTRLAKSISQAFAVGNPIAVQNTEEFERIKLAGPAEGPDANVWSVWADAVSDPNHALAVERARERLVKLPILKQVPCGALQISHDDVKSLLEKSGDGAFGAVGKDSIDLIMLPANQLSSLAFLFGGVGDARHVFGTLVGLYESSLRLTQNQRDALRVDITLLDIKEHVLARDLVIMVLLSEISACSDAKEKLELQATVFYLYTALVMPKFCDAAERILVALSQEVVDVLPWIRVENGSVQMIRSALLLWTTLPSKSTADFISQHRFSPDADQNSSLRLGEESSWYAQVKAFLPPVEFWNRHSEFSTFRQPNAKAKIRAAANHVKASWVVNPTLFDDPREVRMEPMDGDTFNSPAFGYVTGFFDSVIAAIQTLHEKIRLEFIHGELQSELLRMRMYPEPRVNNSLPVKYTKMWLSNVPDYTNGPMGTAVFVVPSLQGPSSTASANHLLNFGAFIREPTAFSNTYAHLKPAEFTGYLGCTVVDMIPIDVTILSPLALPLSNSKLATREALKTWLIRVFLCTLINGRKNPIAKIIMPSTFVTFIHLLIHLHKVGYPGHWLSDFLHNLLSNNLVTNILPYTGNLPISQQHDWKQGRPDARLNLRSWIPDMEAIVARTYAALPFALAPPPSFPAAQEIGLFSARVRTFEQASVPDPVAGLVFFNPEKVRNVTDWQKQLLAVLRGDDTGTAAEICMVLSMEAISWAFIGEVKWRMSRVRFKRMVAAKWVVAVYGTLFSCAVQYLERVNVKLGSMNTFWDWTPLVGAGPT
ncbi:hypothetical protein B0H11DRAFT_2227626 [Mycena galericulata]|nr:hypothetical protein B0H11DRAFT_2227626 [Mycena galericulata]